MPVSRERTYRKIPEAPIKLQEELHIIWDALYDLRDNALFDVHTYTLTHNTAIDFPTFQSKPILVILIQDATGGRTFNFASKFKGLNAIIWDTTPNTYSCILMYPLTAANVLCVVGVTGGQL